MQSSSRKNYISHKIQDYQSVSTQTDTVPILENILDENMEKNYTLFIRYINDINTRINEKIKHEFNGFTIPVIPNYYVILHAINKIRSEEMTENCSKFSKIRTVASEEDYVMVSEHQQGNSETTIMSEKPNPMKSNHAARGRLAKSCFGVVSIRPVINNRPHSADIRLVKSSMKARPNTPKKIQSMFQKISRASRSPARDLSSDESVILDDEEFERASQTRRNRIRRQQCLSNTSERDLKRLDRQMVNTTGLLNKHGEVKPETMHVSEKARRSRSNDVKNRPFRVKRQVEDVKVHKRPNSGMGVDNNTNTSMESYMNMRIEGKSEE